MSEICQKTLEMLRRIERNTVDASIGARETQRIGPFLACAHPTSELIWLSYAIPLSQERHGADFPAALTELREWFAGQKRRLRFEILEPLWPDLAPQLIELGLELQGRMPIMLCEPQDLRPAPLPAGTEIASLSGSASDEQLRELSSIARRAFGMEDVPLTPQELEENRQNLLAGRYRSAIARISGEAAAVGSMSVGNDELVGIATIEAFRGRGMGAAISHYLLAEHFGHGAALAWLSAGDDRARRMYERIGFRVVGDQVNLMDQA